ncbi:MAG: SPOR domain-containing protein [Burkholderiales bacterium]|nr:SPOR domain-containing protein [Burkholderiales bacterium]
MEAIAPGGAPLAAAAPAAPPAAAPEGGDAKGVFLQLGAFSARESAEAFRARLALELGGLAETARIYVAGGLYRLKLGPYGSREQARPIAERIESELKLRPLFVAR